MKTIQNAHCGNEEIKGCETSISFSTNPGWVRQIWGEYMANGKDSVKVNSY